MKNRLTSIVIMSLLAVFVLSACGVASDLKTVGDTGKAFMAALRDGDHNTSWNLLTPALQAEIGSYNDWVDWASIRNFSESSFSSTNVEGQQAQMDGEAVIGSETYAVTLVFDKIGDTWLVSGISFEFLR